MTGTMMAVRDRAELVEPADILVIAVAVPRRTRREA
jgi:hypothetical protein